jgi:hypothetical protein
MPLREYTCDGCDKVSTYLLRPGEAPDGCNHCAEPASRLKLMISSLNIGRSSRTNSEFIETGFFQDVLTGEIVPIGITREVRRDGSDVVEVDCVNLETKEADRIVGQKFYGNPIS